MKRENLRGLPVLNHVAAFRRAQAAVQDDAQRLADGGKLPHVQTRIVVQHRADSGEYGATLGALPLHVRPRFFARNPLAPSVRQGSFPVQAGGNFQRNKRAAAFDARQKSSIEGACFIGQQTALHADAGRLQQSNAFAGHQRIRVAHGNHHTCHACRHQTFGTRRCATVMGTGFQRDIRRCTARQIARLPQCMHFGVRKTSLHMKPLPHNLPAVCNHAADARIGRRGKPPEPCQLDGAPHMRRIQFRKL